MKFYISGWPRASLILLAILSSSQCTDGLIRPQRPLLNDAWESPTSITPASSAEHLRWKPSLNFSSPAPHLFHSVGTLLSQFPQTVFPNGHTLAPCIIPPYTLLYHGRHDAGHPTNPDWFAFDVEMSYGIMGSTRSSFMLTYQTTRPIECLHFDGMSAALMGLGQLDSQMLHLFGNITGPPRSDRDRFKGLEDEYLRATKLCKWLKETGLRGHGWGVEGIVRMNAGFEVIWCDFSSPSIQIVSQTNVTAPEISEDLNKMSTKDALQYSTRPETMIRKGGQDLTRNIPSIHDPQTMIMLSTDPPDPVNPPYLPQDLTHEPFRYSQEWGWLMAATYHYGSNINGPGLGEERARLYPCGIISWYSPRLDGMNASLSRRLDEKVRLNLTVDGTWRAPSNLTSLDKSFTQLRRRRRLHHLENATPEEALYLRQRSEISLKTLLKKGQACSGVEAEFLAQIPEKKSEIYTRTWLHELRDQTHLFMMPYLQYPASFKPDNWKLGSSLFNETYSRCKYRYTTLLAPDQGIILLPEEADLKWAVEETYGTICKTLVSTNFELEDIWGRYIGWRNDKVEMAQEPTSLVVELEQKSQCWARSISELVAWLGWENEYIGCPATCDWDELCYVPMWPLMHWKRRFPPYNETIPPYHNDGDKSPPPPPPPPDISSKWHGGAIAMKSQRPPITMSPRDKGWMEDDTGLWEPKCVKAYFIGGR